MNLSNTIRRPDLASKRDLRAITNATRKAANAAHALAKSLKEIGLAASLVKFSRKTK